MMEMTKEMIAIMRQQGWNIDSMLAMAIRFMAKCGTVGDFEEFLEKQADEENDYCRDEEEEEEEEDCD